MYTRSIRTIRSVVVAFALTCVFGASLASAAEIKYPPMPEVLPEGTIVLVECGPWSDWSSGFSNTALAKVFSEPEVRTFLAGPFGQLSAMLRRLMEEQRDPGAPPPPPPAQGGEKTVTQAIASAFQVLGDAARGPMVVAVRYSQTDEQEKRAPAVAVILGLSDPQNVEGTNNFLAGVLDKLLKDWKVESVVVADYQNTKLLSVTRDNAGQRQTVATVMFHKGLFVVSNDTKLCTQLVDGMAGTLSRKLSDTEAYKATGLVGDENLMAYIDVAGLQRALGSQQAGGEGDRVRDFLALAGLEQTSVAAWSLKMNGPAFESRTAIFSQKQRTGVLGMLAEEPISADALKMLPKSTPFAAGLRLQPDRVLPFVRSAIRTTRGDKALENFNDVVKQFNAELGKDFEKEMRAAFGNEVIVASLGATENAGPVGVTAFVASMSVQDAKRADDLLLQVLTRTASRIDPQGATANVLKDLDYEGLKIRYLTPPRVAGVLDVSPAFVVVENRMLIALDVPTLKVALRTLKEPGSLGDSEAFKTALAQTGGKMGPLFTYVDWAYSYRQFVGFSTTALRVMAPADVLRAAGIDLNLVPSTETVSRHLFPGLSVAKVTPTGVSIISRSPVPSLEVVVPPITTVGAVLATFKPFTPAK